MKTKPEKKTKRKPNKFPTELFHKSNPPLIFSPIQYNKKDTTKIPRYFQSIFCCVVLLSDGKKYNIYFFAKNPIPTKKDEEKVDSMFKGR